MEFISSYLLALVIHISAIQLFGSFLPGRQLPFPLFPAIAVYTVPTTLVHIYVGEVLAANLFAKLLFNFIIFLIPALVFFRAPFWNKAFVSLLFLAITMLMDVATSVVLATITTISAPELAGNMQTYLIGAGLSHLLVFVVCLVIKKVRASRREGYRLSYKEWLRLLLFPAISSFVLLGLYNQLIVANALSWWVAASVAGLLLGNIALLFLVDSIEQDQKMKEANRLLEMRMAAEMNHVTTLMEYNTNNARLFHDHANHLRTICTLLDYNSTAEAKDYAARLCEYHKDSRFVVYTNNPVADAVLNMKYIRAKGHGISMQFDLSDLSAFPLPGDALATVLTNLLDNAIEACQQVGGQPKIKVKITCEGREAMVSIKNTVASPVNIVDNMVETSKENRSTHGFGLKNINAVMEKYGCDYALACVDGWFQFTALIS